MTDSFLDISGCRFEKVNATDLCNCWVSGIDNQTGQAVKIEFIHIEKPRSSAYYAYRVEEQKEDIEKFFNITLTKNSDGEIVNYPKFDMQTLSGLVITEICGDWDTSHPNHEITQAKIDAGQIDKLCFAFSNGLTMTMYHSQDCCEKVYLHDVVGDLNDLIGSPLTFVDVSTNSNNPPDNDPESYTWTFYKLATFKGFVDLRFLGTSNGWYSENVHVSFLVIKDPIQRKTTPAALGLDNDVTRA